MYLKSIKILWTFFFTTLISFTLYVLAVWMNLFYLFGGMPNYDELENKKNAVASQIISADGKLLGSFFRENRNEVTYKKISPHVINALISTEDERFEQHAGIDLIGTLSLVYYNMIIFKKRGSSTITQQTAKNLFQMRDKPEYQGIMTKIPGIGMLVKKTKEWITTIRLERGYAKKEIITLYLNTVDFGNHAYGIKVASQNFFGVNPDQLNIQQAALLVGLLKGPSYYSPYKNIERAQNRRNTVFGQMQRCGHLTESEVDSLSALPIEVLAYDADEKSYGKSPYLKTAIKEDLQEWCTQQGIDIHADGLKIYTTIDSRVQQYTEEAIKEHMAALQARFFKVWNGKNPWVDENWKEIPKYLEKEAEKTPRFKALMQQYNDDKAQAMKVFQTPIKMKVFDWNSPNYEKEVDFSPMDSLKYYKHFLHVGAMSTDPQGKILSWVGGINFKYFKYDHVRQGQRQPGSTFKPFIYAAAIDKGLFDPCSEVLDVPRTIVISENPYKIWQPKNADGKYSQQNMTLRNAMARSVNSIAAFLIDKITVNEAVRYAKDVFGITSNLDAVPALCLGISDVSVYEMVGGYATFLNNGIYTRPYLIERIEDKDGNVLYENIPAGKHVLSEQTAATMLYMLRGNVEEPGGTGGKLRSFKFAQANQVGGKTGTTSNYSDGWYIGMTKDIVLGIWVGADDRRIHFKSIADGAGGKMAMPIFAKTMEKVYADKSIKLKKGAFPALANTENQWDCQLKYLDQWNTDSLENTIDLNETIEVD